LGIAVSKVCLISIAFYWTIGTGVLTVDLGWYNPHFAGISMYNHEKTELVWIGLERCGIVAKLGPAMQKCQFVFDID
jgi:hypothetical protein